MSCFLFDDLLSYDPVDLQVLITLHRNLIHHILFAHLNTFLLKFSNILFSCNLVSILVKQWNFIISCNRQSILHALLNKAFICINKFSIIILYIFSFWIFPVLILCIFFYHPLWHRFDNCYMYM